MSKNESRVYLVGEWIKHAADDELNARALLKDRDGTPAQVCFLSQQIAEKYFKALILHATGDYPKLHDFNKLILLLKDSYSDIESLKEDALLLDPYYVGTRYPADLAIETITWGDAEEAFEAAIRVKEFVSRRINSAEVESGFGLLGIIIVSAVIAAVIIGGWSYLKESQKQKSLLETGQEAEKKAIELKDRIEKKNVNAIDNELDISAWQTYRNEKYGFEMGHPSSFELSESRNMAEIKIGGGFSEVTISISPLLSKRRTCISGEDIKCSIVKTTDGDAIIQHNMGGGFAAYLYDSKGNEFVVSPHCKPFATKEELISGTPFCEVRNDAIFNQILSTFKFIE